MRPCQRAPLQSPHLYPEEDGENDAEGKEDGLCLGSQHIRQDLYTAAGGYVAIARCCRRSKFNILSVFVLCSWIRSLDSTELTTITYKMTKHIQIQLLKRDAHQPQGQRQASHLCLSDVDSKRKNDEEANERLRPPGLVPDVGLVTDLRKGACTDFLMASQV